MEYIVGMYHPHTVAEKNIIALQNRSTYMTIMILPWYIHKIPCYMYLFLYKLDTVEIPIYYK